MRVLFVLDSLSPGGAETSTVAMLPELQRRGIEVELATMHARSPGLQDEVRAMGVPLHELSGLGAPDGSCGQVQRLRRLDRLIERVRPDLVHTSLYEADVCGRVAARRRGIPVVSTLPTERYGPDRLGAGVPGLKLRLAQLVDAMSARATVHLHAVSDHVAEAMASQLRYPRDRISVVHRGRPASLVEPSPPEALARLRDELGVGSAPLILALARHDAAKGLTRLVEAMPLVLRSIPDARLIVAGKDGEQTADLRNLVRHSGLEACVELIGHRSDAPQLLQTCDAFVLPSIREGLPGSLIEALAAGAPAIVNDLPQMREVASPNEALFVDAGDKTLLAAAIVETLADRTATEGRVDAGRIRFLEAFTLERTGAEMAHFLRGALNGGEG